MDSKPSYIWGRWFLSFFRPKIVLFYEIIGEGGHSMQPLQFTYIFYPVTNRVNDYLFYYNMKKCIRVVTNEKLPLDPKAIIEIENSSLHQFEKFTICGSLKTVQFSNFRTVQLKNKLDHNCQAIIQTSFFGIGSTIFQGKHDELRLL